MKKRFDAKQIDYSVKKFPCSFSILAKNEFSLKVKLLTVKHLFLFLI